MMKNKYLVCAALVMTFVVANVTAQEDRPIKSNASDDRQVQQDQLIFIDPETGEMTSQPTDEQDAGVIQEGKDLPEAELRSVDPSKSGIASEPFLMPDGSRKIDFNGQFNKPLKASVDENGVVEVGHDVEINGK